MTPMAKRPAQITDSIFKQLTRQGFSISPRDAPELCTNIALENRGRRESRVPAAPAASRAK
jgi:hypothetical protein